MGIPIETLDGGEVITIGGPNGSYTELTKQPIDQRISYSNASRTSTLPLPVPDALMASIPGFQFPAIDGIEIPDVEPIVVLDDSPENVLGASFRWVVGIDPAARVVVSANTITANGEAFSFLCTVVDDGEFTAPDWALEDLRDITTGVGVRSMVRTHEKLTVVGDVMVVAKNTSQYTSIVSR